MMAISSVSDRGFGEQVLRQDSPVLVAFRAAWCVPSQQLAPSVDDLAARYEGRIKVVTVDVEDDPKANKVCRRYKVTRLPVVMLFHEGRVKDVIGGAASADTVTDMLERHLRPVLDVGEHNFDVEVLKSPVPVLVHVDAAWCAASLRLAPVVESAAEKYRRRAKVVRLEYGPDTARLCAQYGFVRVPTLAVFVHGKVEDQILGAMTGGTKTDVRATSCVGLSAEDNVAQMLDQFVL